MKKLFLALGLSLLSSAAVLAQSTDIKKGEVYVGYSNGQIDTGIDSGNSISDFFADRENFNGFEAAGVYNLTRYIGIKGDFSAHYNSTRFNETIPGTPAVNVTVKNNNSLYNFLGGVQVKDNAKSGTWKPFAHALVGAANARSKFTELTCTVTGTSTPCPTGFTDDTFSETGFAAALGGGLDIRLNNKIQIRAIQLDWNPVRLSGVTNNNFRIGAGIVF